MLYRIKWYCIEPLKDPITGKEIKEKYNSSTFAYGVANITPLPSIIESTLGKQADTTDLDAFRRKQRMTLI